MENFIFCAFKQINPFVLNAPFLYPLKTSENPKALNKWRKCKTYAPLFINPLHFTTFSSFDLTIK